MFSNNLKGCRSSKGISQEDLVKKIAFKEWKFSITLAGQLLFLHIPDTIIFGKINAMFFNPVMRGLIFRYFYLAA
jgi:hypothetical protein